MGVANRRDQFLDYFEDRMSDSERNQFERALESDDKLRDDFFQYKGVLALESQLAKSSIEPPADLTQYVMDGIKPAVLEPDVGLLRGLLHRPLLPILGVAAVASLVLLASRENMSLPSNSAEETESFAPVERVSVLSAAVLPDGESTTAKTAGAENSDAPIIPSGFRAVTFQTDTHGVFRGDAKPGTTRVDVLLSYPAADGATKVMTVTRFAKLLSVDEVKTDEGVSNPDAAAVTLLVTESDAERVNMAKTVGKLSVMPIGEDAPEKNEIASEKVAIPVPEVAAAKKPADALGEEKSTQGTVSIKDPQSGKPVQLVLHDSTWKVDGTGSVSDRNDVVQLPVSSANYTKKNGPVLGSKVQLGFRYEDGTEKIIVDNVTFMAAENRGAAGWNVIMSAPALEGVIAEYLTAQGEFFVR